MNVDINVKPLFDFIDLSQTTLHTKQTPKSIKHEATDHT